MICIRCILFHWVEHRSMKSLAVEHAFAKSCNNYPTRSHQVPPGPTRSHQVPPGPNRFHQVPPGPTRSHQSGSPPFASDLRKWYLKSGWPMLILESESEVGVSWGIPELQKASTTKQCQTLPNHRRTHSHDKWQNFVGFSGFCGPAPRPHPTIYQIGHCSSTPFMSSCSKARNDAKKKVNRSRTTGWRVWRYTGASGFFSLVVRSAREIHHVSILWLRHVPPWRILTTWIYWSCRGVEFSNVPWSDPGSIETPYDTI